MIQRKQTIWLFLAAFLSGALFIFPLYHYTPSGSNIRMLLAARNEYLLLVLAALMSVLPLLAIFMFKNRKKQKNTVLLSVFFNAAFIAAMLYHIQSLKNAALAATDDNFALPGPIIPILSIVLLIMAYNGIRKDEALIKSVDRLR